MSKCRMYNLINYFDVWGNEEEGYTVNNQCVEKENVCIPDDVKCYEIIDYLKCIGFLKNDCETSDFNINMDYEIIEISTAENDYPLCAFMCVEG